MHDQDVKDTVAAETATTTHAEEQNNWVLLIFHNP
jgi:hypothetical protein